MNTSKTLDRILDAAKLDLTDPALFGNDAGEDEDPQVLASYFVDKPSFRRFAEPQTRLAIARARKGLGKSALLAKVAYEASAAPGGRALIIFVKGSDLTGLGEFLSSDPAVLVNQWQQVICARINLEIGRQIDFALTDCSISMVESAELSGFKNRNIVGALIDRLRIKFKVGGIEIDPQKLNHANSLFALRNYNSDESELRVWLIVDDIDSTFIDSPSARLKIATFFSACRKLITDVTGIVIRASIRTDVWTAIRRIDESLDKCEQYIIDISWSNEEAKLILANKILSYIRRTSPGSESIATPINQDQATRVINSVFVPRLRWGSDLFPPDRPIHILSAGRPRWSGQLCRLAAQEAARQKANRIGIQAINSVLPQFGRFRLDDLYREHRHQFNDLKTLIESFAGGPSRLSTEELRTRINRLFLGPDRKANISLVIDGVPVRDTTDLSHFLYKIGFIFGRDDRSQGPLSFVRYEERPDLLTDYINLDDGLLWEIHPSYRSALNMK